MVFQGKHLPALLAAPLLAYALVQAKPAHNLAVARAKVAQSPRRLWQVRIDPNADSSPAYLPHVSIKHRSRPVVYVLAGNNTSNCDPGDPVRKATTYAFDAGNGHLLWRAATTGPSRCTTAGPVVDPSGKWVYSPGLDGKVHRYAAASGKESTVNGWPRPVTLMPDVEKVAATPTIGNGHLYVATSGFIGDQGHYQGHLVTVSLTSGGEHVFNSLCSNIHQLLGPSAGRQDYCSAERSGLFGRGEGVIDPLTHDVYAVSGNGPWNGRTNWGDTILKLNAAGNHLLDAFTPTNQAQLAPADQDLGSTGPALLPPIKESGHTHNLLVQGGKGPSCSSCGPVVLRLLNRDNLSGRRGPGHLGGDLQDIAAPAGCEVLTAPAVWKSPSHQTWVFYTNDCAVAGYQLVGSGKGKFRLVPRWLLKRRGSTPAISRGVLWVARNGEVLGHNPVTGALLWRASGIGDLHWEYPLVVGHRLFMTDQSGHLTAFSVP